MKFHDGSPFTADDVIFSFDRIRQPQGTMQIYVTGIKEIRKVDDFTVDLILDSPQPILLRNLVDFRIMSKVWAEKNRATQMADYKAKDENYASRHTDGTGPYEIRFLAAGPEGLDDDQQGLVGQEQGQHHRGQLHPDQVGSDARRGAHLGRRGPADRGADPGRRRGEGPMRSSSRSKGPRPAPSSSRWTSAATSCAAPRVKGKNPFKDIRVREALSIAIDREAIKRSIMRGLSVPASLMVSPGVNGYDAALDKPAKPDLARAKTLLADAGYPNGFELPLNCPNNRYVNDEKICLAVVSMWSKIGVTARLTRAADVAAQPAVPALRGAAVHAGLGRVHAMRSTRCRRSRAPRGGAGRQLQLLQDQRPGLDKLIDAAKTEIDTAKRDAILRDALVRTRDQYLFIPLHHTRCARGRCAPTCRPCTAPTTGRKRGSRRSSDGLMSGSRMSLLGG